MRSVHALGLAVLVGCSSSYGEGTSTPADAGTVEDAGTTSCLDKPFADIAYFPAPINQPNISTYSASAGVDAQQLLVYCQDQGSGADIYLVARPDPGAAWGPPSLTGLSTSTSYECDPSFGPDLKTLYFTSDRPGGVGGRDIWSSTRSLPGVAFGTPKDVGAVSSGNDDESPWPTASGTLYFQSNRGGIDRIWSSKYSNATSNFTAPTEVGELNDLGPDGTTANGAPVLSGDELTIYFARKSPATDWDVWMARRASTAEPFGAPTLVKELSSDKKDRPTWVSPDGCRIAVQTYSRPGEQHPQIFFAERK